MKLFLILFSSVLTAAAANVPASFGSSASLPFVTVSAKGQANGLSNKKNDGLDYGPDTPGTLTCGIQEAINALPVAASATVSNQPGGGMLVFSPGTFIVQTNIVTPPRTNGFGLTFRGSALNACGLLFSNTVPMELLTVGNTSLLQLVTFKASDMFFASVTNACTNIVHLKGYNGSVGDFSSGGGIGRASIERCWFGWWGALTNGGFTPSKVSSTSVTNNLIGLNMVKALEEEDMVTFPLRFRTVMPGE